MGAMIQGYSQSTLSVNSTGIEIRLPKGVFGHAWPTLLASVLAAIGQNLVLVFSQRVMTQAEPGEESPRWKSNPVDVLSWLLFLLKVSAQHELVRLWQVIDWAQINRLAAPFYRNAQGGRPAWAPAQLVAILVLMFLYGVAHETQIVARIQENLVWCWFCGFGLFGPFPKHDALYDFRQRVGAECFEQMLTLVVLACLEAGLVSNALVYFDLTPVVASAHRWSPYERVVILTRALIRYLEQVWADQAPTHPFPEALRSLAAEVALEVLPHKSLAEVRPERVVESVAQWTAQAADAEPTWQQTSEAIVAELVAEAVAPRVGTPPDAPLRTRLKALARTVMTRLPHTRGDLDARVGRTTSYTWFCGYLMGFVVDSLRHIITAVVWGAGDAEQAALVQPALDAHSERLGPPHAAALDSAFDKPKVHTYLDQHGIVGHVTSRAHVTPPDGGYGTDRVTWVAGEAQPRCPAGQPLRPQGPPHDGRQTYAGTACAACPLYQACYPSGQAQPKHFTLNPADHQRWQANRQHNQTEAYKTAQRQRFVSEGRFGLAKTNHHGAKAPYRSDDMNRIAGLLIAMVMNCRVLARHRAAPSRAAV